MASSKSTFSRPDGGKLFLAVFVVAVMTAAAITYVSITNVDLSRPLPAYVFWICAVNGVLIALLAFLFVRRYRNLRQNSKKIGDGRLVSRFLVLFSVSSAVPLIIVAIFLAATVAQSQNNWYEDRIGTIIEDNRELAQENLDAVTANIEARSRELAARVDFEDTAAAIENDPVRYASYLGRQARALGVRTAFIVSSDGTLLITAEDANPVQFRRPTVEALNEANQGNVGQIFYRGSGIITATVQLNYPDDSFMHTVHEFDRRVSQRLDTAVQAGENYRRAGEVSGQLRIFYVINYAQVVLLALLLFARIGLEAANQIAVPLVTLAEAAEKVRDGDLTARVALPGNDDEIDTLAVSFNTMTAQLGTQRAALLSARAVSEDRRQFLETLLSEVSAGVIRTDPSLNITLANRSAEILINRTDLQGKNLGDIIPEFQLHANTAMREGVTGDTSLEVDIDDEKKHIRLRTLADAEGGCVLTFDDTTKIITAQRHMAWRDVARRIAHEIRNPLTPIHLAAERLNRRYSSVVHAEDDVFKRSLDTITRQATDIGRMVDEFSNFARMPKPEIRPFDFVAMISDIIFSQRMVAPDIKIEIATGSGSLIFHGDERLLGQAFTNLVKNATEAISGMSMEVEVIGQIVVDIVRVDDALMVTITDNGPGFPAESRERLLEPYITTRQRGTGLGLAIVNRVIIDHGGSISLKERSDRQRGAQVNIVLPYEDLNEDVEQHSTISSKEKV